MRTRDLIRALLLIAVSGMLSGIVLAAEPAPLRVNTLPEHLGQTVTVKGRTGIRVETRGTPTTHVYTLRDDYGDQVYVLTKQDYPVMGVTLLVTGETSRDAATNDIYLIEQSRKPAYASVPLWMIAGLTVVVVATALVVLLLVRRQTARASLAPAWGYAAVTSGPDQGKHFALRGNRILIGRGQDPSTAISFELDTSISRTHGVITRQGNQIYYEDSNSRNGSWLGANQVSAGQRVAIPPGALLRLGAVSVVRLEVAGAESGGQTMTVSAPGSRGEDMTQRAT